MEGQWQFQGGGGSKSKSFKEMYGANLEFLEGTGCKPKHHPWEGYRYGLEPLQDQTWQGKARNLC